MLNKSRKLAIVSALCVLAVWLAACNGLSSTPPETGQVPKATSKNTPIPTTAATARATVVTRGSDDASATPPAGPKIIASPTPIPGGGKSSQQVQLADRALLITNVAKQSGADTTSISIVLTLTVQNKSARTIQNQPQFFLLVGSEGDAFGKQTNSSDSFYGPINASSQRSGTIVFQIPTAASNNLRLMYQPENPADTSFVPLVF